MKTVLKIRTPMGKRSPTIGMSSAVHVSPVLQSKTVIPSESSNPEPTLLRTPVRQTVDGKSPSCGAAIADFAAKSATNATGTLLKSMMTSEFGEKAIVN